MKVIFFLLASTLVIVSFVVFLTFAPYHFYFTTVNEGLVSEYLTMKGQDKLRLKPEDEFLSTEKLVYKENENQWRNFHFGDLNVPFPLSHPMFLLIPHIDFNGAYNELGAKYLTRKEKDIANFLILKSEALELSMNRHRIFDLPYFKAMIQKKTQDDIWRDLFTLNVTLPDKGNKSYIEYAKVLYEIDYRTLVYNLYILKLRERYFPVNMMKFSLFKKGDIGVVRLESQKEGRLIELFLIPHKGRIYRMKFEYEQYDVLAETIRARILDGLKYTKSSEDTTNAIYAQYKKLEYRERIDQKGMVYLYAAWSHVPEKREFLKEMIRFLERGQGNQVYLKALYDYAYRLYGTNFSLSDSERVETNEQKLERLINEEKNAEYEKAKNERVDIQDGEFESNEDKIDYFLKKAKSSGKNSDESDDILRSP
ncbi:hypothetical protein HBN50_08325 [Halobacteriovorax sp. GB3]|uniref:hypothetical protein n=1 Tax=Halobacteriovorax sp. GB3 TaxID=2719615 RepID=UPI00235E48D5|nr:hypothetical protein [Halobacteriovorax sp. GB3]MDD0853099.1 hypothetical protein [Halobacteriovorax sp. GB3]